MCSIKRLEDDKGKEKGWQYIVSYDYYRKEVDQVQLDLTSLFWERPVYGANGVRSTTQISTFSKKVQTIQPFSNKLLFIPAPYEFFYTPHTKPQVYVKSNGLRGVGDDIRNTVEKKCDFEYIDSTP